MSIETLHHHRSKLTAVSVAEIRALHLTGQTQSSLAQRFGVSQPTIMQVVRYATWRPANWVSEWDRMLHAPAIIIPRGHNNRDKTHCKRGHPFDEENTRYKAGGRECKTCMRLRTRSLRGPSESRHPKYGHVLFRRITTTQVEDIQRRILDGQSLSQISRYVGCSIMTISRYARRIENRPKCRCGLSGGHAGLCTWFTRGVAVYPFIFGDGGDSGSVLLRTINNCVPKGIPEDLRQDICQNLALRVLEENLEHGQIAAYVKEEINRQYAPYHKERSLDDPIGDGNRLYGHVLGIY